MWSAVVIDEPLFEPWDYITEVKVKETHLHPHDLGDWWSENRMNVLSCRSDQNIL